MSDTTTNGPAPRRTRLAILVISALVLAGLSGLAGGLIDRFILNTGEVSVSSFKPALSSAEAELAKAGLSLARRQTSYGSDARRDVTSSSWEMRGGNVVTVTGDKFDTFVGPGKDALDWCSAPELSMSTDELLALGSAALVKARAAWPHYAKSDNGFSNWGDVTVAGTKVTCYHKTGTSN